MQVKNRPKAYVKRSDLPERLSRLEKRDLKVTYTEKKRDLSTAHIDADFYILFRTGAVRRNP